MGGPYGRGFFYLARTDEQLREASGGARSLDDIVLSLCRCPAEKQTEEEYRRLLERELGEEGLRAFEEMRNGALMVPPPALFGGVFERMEESGPDDRGEGLCTRYRFRLRAALSGQE